MTTSGKDFINNLRNARLNPLAPWAPSSLLTRGDIVKQNQKWAKEERADEIAERKDIDNLIKETEPLRDTIKKVSGGKVVVDNSIYDGVKLERILDSVKKMQETNNGLLQVPYVVISDGEDGMRPLGSAAYEKMYYLKPFPNIKFQLSPSNTYNGTKNSPYRITLKEANNTIFNDWQAYNDNGWSVNVKNNENFLGIDSAVHAHELAHTAYYDALKKTQNSLLPSNEQTKEKIKTFKQTHPSLQEIFDIAARNTGYDTVQDAAASISRYALYDAKKDTKNGGLDASKNWGPNYQRLPELFAEAYVDYLYNKENASNYSKELIKLYADYINDYNRTFNNKITLDSSFKLPKNKDGFIENFRKVFSE